MQASNQGIRISALAAPQACRLDINQQGEARTLLIHAARCAKGSGDRHDGGGMIKTKSTKAITPKSGWAGIQAALKRAKSGDVVSIGAGEYSGQETLSVPAGVTLRGESGAKLTYSGHTAAILLENADKARVESIELHGYAGLEDSPEAGDPVGTEIIGLIQILSGRGATVTGCNVKASAKRHSCIAAVYSEETAIHDNTVSGARLGIAFWSAEGEIERNEASQCSNGIQLALWREKLEVRSTAKVRANKSHDNGNCGIWLISSCSVPLEENRCWRNNGNGIELSTDGDGLSMPSQALIRRNYFCENGMSGVGIHNHCHIVATSPSIEIPVYPLDPR